MKNIKISFWSILLVFTALWMFADSFLPEPFTYFSFRDAFVQYTGIIAIAAMSITLYLATRPKWLDQNLDGLDKVYRLHKWLGIAALVTSLLHWWWAKATKYLVQLGMLEKPNHQGGKRQQLHGILQFFSEHRGHAEKIGEIAFYVFLILLVVALLKRIPYKTFLKTHIVLAYVFIVLVLHSVVLMKADYWLQPIGILTAAVMLLGVISSLLIIFGKIGASSKAKGHAIKLDYYPELSINDIDIQIDEGWNGHKAGQFAFVQSPRNEKPHPYTIASGWNPKTKTVKFITKSLGDYTRTLHDQLKVDEKVTIEGPYGKFTFDDEKNQIWIGGGIGITPFIAKMNQIDIDGKQGERKITLFHSTKEHSDKALNLLKEAAELANVELHIFEDAKDGYLTGEKLRNLVPDFAERSFWFCGPAKFGQILKNDLVAHGFDKNNYHQELFEMR